MRPVLVAKVISKDVPTYLDEIGTCAAYETVQVQAQVAGKILARHFQDGADVKKGDLLFTIDPAPFQAALDQAKAQAALDQVTMKRQADLRSKGVNAPQDYDTAVANAQKSQAAAEAPVASDRTPAPRGLPRGPRRGRGARTCCCATPPI